MAPPARAIRSTPSTTVRINIIVSDIYTLSVKNTLHQFDDKLSVFDVHKADINNSKKLPVVITYYSPENSSIIRAVPLEYPVMFVFRVKNSNPFERFESDKHNARILKVAFNYTNLVKKVPVISEFSLMKVMAQLHHQPLCRLWKKTETQLQSLRALHESLVQEKAGHGISENYKNMERELQESLADIHDVDWVSEIPKLKQKFIWRGEIMHYEYLIKVLKKALDSVLDASVQVARATRQLTVLKTEYETSLDEFFTKFGGIPRKRLLERSSNDLDDTSSELQSKNEETLSKSFISSDHLISSEVEGARLRVLEIYVFLELGAT
ncbi:uncharacterized protein LOC135836775 isoform X2 [Planococcus citri]|uniref:uncharacterized protein LOC135836775 isoform X2 n=1 Tax=Planococcus citri TaxID=170843 RepID=UPI0031FA420F